MISTSAVLLALFALAASAIDSAGVSFFTVRSTGQLLVRIHGLAADSWMPFSPTSGDFHDITFDQVR